MSEKSPATGTPPPTAPPVGGDVESQVPGETRFGLPSILSKWRTEDKIKRGSFALRAVALIFSLLAFIIMATNSHGNWKDFDKYQEYR